MRYPSLGATSLVILVIFFILKCLLYFDIFAPLPEVRILVDSTWDEAGHSLLVPKDEREGGGKARSCLNGWKADLPNWTAVVETENTLHLVVRHTLLDLDNVLVEGRTLAHESEVGEDEGFFNVESKRNDVLDVLPGQAHRLLLLQILPQELLVVRQLDDQGHVEGLLQPLGEEEGYEVAKVHGVTAGASASVKEELFPFLNLVQDETKVPVREEDSSPEKVMWRFPGHTFQSFQQSLVNST